MPGLTAPSAGQREERGHTASRLQTTVATYESCLLNLELDRRQEDLAPIVMCALRARDAVAAALSAELVDVPALSLIDLNALDRRLQDSAIRISAALGRSVLASWRDTRLPHTGEWWWSLDERAAAADQKPSVVWSIMAGLCIAVSLSITADVSRRFLGVGPDWLGVLSTVSQALLALLAGSALTDAGRRAIERTLGKWGVSTRLQPIWKSGIALMLLLLVLALRFSLPGVAYYYNQIADGFRRNHQVTSAIENYQRAISLDPDYVVAHYNLGSAFEDVLDYDRALSEYQRAHLGDPNNGEVTNNLARLFIQRRNDFDSALSLLDVALGHPQEATMEYALRKNRAWAYLGLKQPSLAEVDLKRALELRPQGAAAHCLMAQALEAESPPLKPISEWESCVRYANLDNPPQVEPTWLATARQRLAGQGSGNG